MRAKRLLIVEDNPALLRGLKDNFRAEGYQVRTASDGKKGLADMLRDPPDLVLLDLMLPKVSGYEICRAARSRQLHLRKPVRANLRLCSAGTSSGQSARSSERRPCS